MSDQDQTGTTIHQPLPLRKPITNPQIVDADDPGITNPRQPQQNQQLPGQNPWAVSNPNAPRPDLVTSSDRTDNIGTNTSERKTWSEYGNLIMDKQNDTTEETPHQELSDDQINKGIGIGISVLILSGVLFLSLIALPSLAGKIIPHGIIFAIGAYSLGLSLIKKPTIAIHRLVGICIGGWCIIASLFLFLMLYIPWGEAHFAQMFFIGITADTGIVSLLAFSHMKSEKEKIRKHSN